MVTAQSGGGGGAACRGGGAGEGVGIWARRRGGRAPPAAVPGGALAWRRGTAQGCGGGGLGAQDFRNSSVRRRGSQSPRLRQSWRTWGKRGRTWRARATWGASGGSGVLRTSPLAAASSHGGVGSGNATGAACTRGAGGARYLHGAPSSLSLSCGRNLVIPSWDQKQKQDPRRDPQ